MIAVQCVVRDIKGALMLAWRPSSVVNPDTVSVCVDYPGAPYWPIKFVQRRSA